MACGLAGIILAIKQEYHEASTILILGVIFDSVDGRVARLTGTQSSFGEQFDSMSDMISFVVAPAILMYQKYLHPLERPGAGVTFIYVLFGALRLARFNAGIHKVSTAYFQGLPSPGAALAIVGYIFLANKYPFLDDFPLIPLVYTGLYAILMISKIPFKSFKDSDWIQKHKKAALFFFFLGASLTFIYYEVMFVFGMAFYVLLSCIIYLKRRREFGEAFPWKEEGGNSH